MPSQYSAQSSDEAASLNLPGSQDQATGLSSDRLSPQIPCKRNYCENLPCFGEGHPSFYQEKWKKSSKDSLTNPFSFCLDESSTNITSVPPEGK